MDRTRQRDDDPTARERFGGTEADHRQTDTDSAVHGETAPEEGAGHGASDEAPTNNYRGPFRREDEKV